MMQKNEDLLLEPWIRYHAYLFGIDNLFVLDNGSTSPTTLAVLRRFESIGLNVYRQHVAAKDFDNKGYIIADLIRKFRDEDKYDAVFPIDCDEFIAITNDNGVSCLRRDILVYLEGLSGSKLLYKVTHCLDNRPGFADLFRLATFRKAFIPVADFKSLDHGFHEPASLSGEPPVESPLIYIHMHFKPHELVKAHARDKLTPFVDVDDKTTLAAYQGVGTHLVRYFFQSADEYYRDIGNYRYPLVSYTGFIDLLQVLMNVDPLLDTWSRKPAGFSRASITRDILELPGPFFGPDYLAANPDVAKSNMNPLFHYCLFGFREKRLLRPKS